MRPPMARFAALRVSLTAEGVIDAPSLIEAMTRIAATPDAEIAVRQKAVIADAAQVAAEVLRSREMNDRELGAALGLDPDAAILLYAMHDCWSLADSAGISWSSIWDALTIRARLMREVEAPL